MWSTALSWGLPTGLTIVQKKTDYSAHIGVCFLMK